MRARGFVVAVALVVAGLALPAHADAPHDQYETYGPSDDTITDVFTGLVWQRKVTEGPSTQTSAQQVCDDFAASDAGAGHVDWRVPTYKELQTLVDEKLNVRYYIPDEANEPFAIDMSAFPDTAPEEYWSQTVASDGSGKGYVVSFKTGEGTREEPTTTFLVRCVTHR